MTMIMKPRDPASSRELKRRIQKLAIKAELGDQPGMVHFRSLIRFEGPGDRAGLKDQGKIRDYLWVMSDVRDQEIYRRKEIAHKRRIHIVVDARDAADPRQGARVAEAALIVGGQALLTPGSAVTMTTFGTTRQVPTTAFEGEHDWPWFDAVLDRVSRLPVASSIGPGALRRACLGTEEPSYIVIVSSAIDPGWVESLNYPQGGSLVMVEFVPDALGQERGVLSDALLAHQPAYAIRNRIEDRNEALAAACHRIRITPVVIAAKGGVLDQFETAAGLGPRRH
jgi:hypothetical protein